MGVLLGALLLAVGIVGIVCGGQAVIAGIAAILAAIGIKKAKDS